MKFLVLMWVVFPIFLFTAASDDTNFIPETFNLINSTNSTYLAKPGCVNRCGDLIVPYPFGIGSNCSISEGFDIYCNTSLNPPRASFNNESQTSIKLISDSTLRTSNSVARKCYLENGTISSSKGCNTHLDTVLPDPYTLSQLNKFRVIGCEEIAFLSGESKFRYLFTGCIAICVIGEEVIGGDCLGNGCCQSSIPNDINNYRAIFSNLLDQEHNISIGRSFNDYPYSYSHSHSYAFLGEASAFKFNGSADLRDDNFIKRIEDTVPVVLEWAISNMSCAKAKATHDFACQLNSECVNSTRDIGGYRCVCKEGYEGNPYLYPGCQRTILIFCQGCFFLFPNFN